MIVSVEKFVRDGKVAVIYSNDHGAGWYSWHGIESLLYDPYIVEQLLSVHDRASDEQAQTVIQKYCFENHQLADHYPFDNLTIAWVSPGEKFRISEYDGLETVCLESSQRWLTA